MQQNDPYKALRLAAEMFEDMQKQRCNVENKIQAFYGVSKDDFKKLRKELEATGEGITFFAMLKQAEEAEKFAGKMMAGNLEKAAGPNLLGFIEATPGIALHTAARLLGVIGNPYIAYPHHWEEGKTAKAKKVLVADEPYVRRVPDLWGYSGYGDASKRPTKGQSQAETFALGNPKAKMLAHIIAGTLIQYGVDKLDFCQETNTKDPVAGYDLEGRKAISDFGEVFLGARKLYGGSLHPDVCVRCGPSGKPAQAGSVRSLGHQHAMATRKVAKELLKQLWIAARADYELEV